MKSRSFVAVLATIAVLPVFAADTYVIDPEHSFPFFEVGHMGFSALRGKFGKMGGKVTLDRAAKSGTINVDIDATSIDTGLPRRDNVLKGEDWFNVAKYPTMIYKSSSLKFNGDQPVAAEGELTVNGITKPVPLIIENVRCGPNPFNKREMCGASASAAIKRSDFGVKGSPSSVADDVKIFIGLEAYKD